jgi:hypothetical protein
MAPKQIEPGKRRTGVVPGSPRSYRHAEGRATTGLDWLVIAGLLLLAAAASAFVLSSRGPEPGSGGATSPPPSRSATTSPSSATPSAARTSSARPSATPGRSTAAPSGEASASAGGSPTEVAVVPGALPSGSPTDEPVDEPTDEPVDEPTDEPVDEPTDEPRGETAEPTDDPGSPTPPTTALTVDSIDLVTTVRSQPVDIAGAAPPGATITRDVPMWFDEHVTARQTGRWTMRVGLSEGDNEIRLRLGEDRATEIVLRLTYRP